MDKMQTYLGFDRVIPAVGLQEALITYAPTDAVTIVNLRVVAKMMLAGASGLNGVRLLFTARIRPRGALLPRNRTVEENSLMAQPISNDVMNDEDQQWDIWAADVAVGHSITGSTTQAQWDLRLEPKSKRTLKQGEVLEIAIDAVSAAAVAGTVSGIIYAQIFTVEA